MSATEGLSCAICQPHYLPWIGYFDLIDRADLFVAFDDVQFIKREWKNRNRIRKVAGSAETKWLTVPTVKQPWPGKALNATPLARDRDFWREHRRQVRAVYAKAPHIHQVMEFLDSLESTVAEAQSLADLNCRLIDAFCARLGIDTPRVRASDYAVEGAKTERLLALCHAVGASRYIANQASRTYLETARMARAGVRVAFQAYEHPGYPQELGRAAQPPLTHLSIVDLMAHHGDDALAIIRSGRRAGELAEAAE